MMRGSTDVRNGSKADAQPSVRYRWKADMRPRSEDGHAGPAWPPASCHSNVPLAGAGIAPRFSDDGMYRYVEVDADSAADWQHVPDHIHSHAGDLVFTVNPVSLHGSSSGGVPGLQWRQAPWKRYSSAYGA
jgi:hypothetical protein